MSQYSSFCYCQRWLFEIPPSTCVLCWLQSYKVGKSKLLRNMSCFTVPSYFFNGIFCIINQTIQSQFQKYLIRAYNYCVGGSRCRVSKPLIVDSFFNFNQKIQRRICNLVHQGTFQKGNFDVISWRHLRNVPVPNTFTKQGANEENEVKSYNYERSESESSDDEEVDERTAMIRETVTVQIEGSRSRKSAEKRKSGGRLSSNLSSAN